MMTLKEFFEENDLILIGEGTMPFREKRESDDEIIAYIPNKIIINMYGVDEEDEE